MTPHTCKGEGISDTVVVTFEKIREGKSTRGLDTSTGK